VPSVIFVIHQSLEVVGESDDIELEDPVVHMQTRGVDISMYDVKFV
jgi:hypothetical protein